MLKNLYLLAACCVAVLIVGCPRETAEEQPEPEPTKQLAVKLASGDAKQAGSTVTYEVAIDGGPSAISAFGLDVHYDPAALKYVSWEKGALTEGFTQVGANQVSEGVLRIGGFTVSAPVAAGAHGAIAQVQFEVVSVAPASLALSNNVDDISAFTKAD